MFNIAASIFRSITSRHANFQKMLLQYQNLINVAKDFGIYFMKLLTHLKGFSH